MKKGLLAVVACGALVVGSASVARADVIDFTGGTAVFSGGSTAVTNNAVTYFGVDYYTESGFTLDFIGDTGIVGDYYVGGNDVIHGHWDSGDYGTLTSIEVTKNDGTAFDLNYFILTSNTDTGGGMASGNEQAYITASNGFSLLLPTDDWGWMGPNTQIWLGSEFDDITSFTFTVANAVDCYGMDEFYIDEPPPVEPPTTVPEPGALFLLGTGLVALAGARRMKRA